MQNDIGTEHKKQCLNFVKKFWLAAGTKNLFYKKHSMVQKWKICELRMA